MLEDGFCPQPTVYEEGVRESYILDKYGNPYVYKKSIKIGFDLTPRNSNYDIYKRDSD